MGGKNKIAFLVPTPGASALVILLMGGKNKIAFLVPTPGA
jgi:hypothetical protein